MSTSVPNRAGWLPQIDKNRCTGCGRCVAACDPLYLLTLQAERWQKFASLHEPGRCTGCSACAVVCPFHAITMRKAPALPTEPGGKATLAHGRDDAT